MISENNIHSIPKKLSSENCFSTRNIVYLNAMERMGSMGGD